MLHTLKGRLASSSSRLILGSLVATAAMAAGATTASAQTLATASAQPLQTARVLTIAASAADTAAATDAATDQSTSGSTQVGELIVTARLREEKMQTVPENIVAIPQEVLQQNEVVNFFTLQGFAPSVDVDTAYIKDYSSVLIRGFAASAYFNEVNTQPYSLYDISNVQILYGPQGTLFGYTALGGAVLYTPFHPQLNTFGASIDVMEGNLNQTNVQGYVNIPILKDQLALRISFERDHTDGYTGVQGTGVMLDSNDNVGLRMGLQWNPGSGRLTNYFVAQWDHQFDTPTARLVTMYNPLYVPTPSPTVYSGTSGTFNAYCTATILADFWAPGTTAAQCEAQHAAVYQSFYNQVQQALALTVSSGDREEPAPIENSPLIQLADNIGVEDIFNYDVVHWGSHFLGGGDIYIHNIATDIWYRNFVANFTVGAYDYYAASGEQDIIPSPAALLNPGTTTAPTTEFGNGAELGNMNDYWQDEFQIHGTLDTDLGSTPGVTWVVGFFNYWAQAERNPLIQTSQNIPISYGGAFTADEGPTPATAYPNGYWVADYDQYMNVTIDSGMFWKPLKGLEFTGGFRFNHNLTKSATFAVVTNYGTGQLTGLNPVSGPWVSGTVSSATVRTENNPDNWNWSVNYVTPSNNLYISSAYVVVAGFANAVPAVPASDVPGYVPAALNETLIDYELGDKWNFHFGQVRGYADLDGYYEKLGSVQIAQTVFVAATGTYFSYTSNPAGLIREGVEFQGEIFPVSNLDIYANLSYAHDYYQNWYQSDPYGYVRAYYLTPPTGYNQSLCDPTHSAATVPAGGNQGTCIMNFSATPPPYVPTWQAAIRARYTFMLGDNIGNLVPNATFNFQTLEYFAPGTNYIRESQLLGNGVYTAMSAPQWYNINLRLEWDKVMGHDNLTAAAFVTNLTNGTHPIGGIDTLFAVGVATENFNPPREYGFEVSAKW